MQGGESIKEAWVAGLLVLCSLAGWGQLTKGRVCAHWRHWEPLVKTGTEELQTNAEGRKGETGKKKQMWWKTNKRHAVMTSR